MGSDPNSDAMRTALILTLALTTGAAAADWPQWRGPARTGATTDFTPPADWPARPRLAWKQTVGEGHASPVIAGGRVFVFTRVGDQEVASARDLATGKEIWKQAYAAPYEMNPSATGHGKGPKSTPVLADGRLYTFGISGVLSAWQAQDGRLLWRKDFAKEHKSRLPDFGVAMSPLVAGTTLVVHTGGTGSGALRALDAITGGAKWTWTRDGPAYASPIVADLGGTPQVITMTQKHLVALSLADGRELWQLPFETSYDQNSVTPLVVGDLVVYGGMSKPTAAIRVTSAAGKWNVETVWQIPELPMYMSSPVASGGYLFGLSQRNRGQFFCVDVRSGKIMWTSKGREAENAALVTAGSLVLAATTEGELVVMRNTPGQFDVVKRYTIAESPVWAHPAPAGNGLVVKDVDSLAFWQF